MLILCKCLLAVALAPQGIGGKYRPQPLSLSPDLPKVGGTIRMEHFWVNQLVDYLSVTIPSSVSSPYQEVVRRIDWLYGIVDRPSARAAVASEETPVAYGQPKDLFAMSLVWWGRSKALGDSAQRARCKKAALSSLDRCVAGLGQDPKTDADLRMLAKLARILVRGDDKTIQLGELRSLESEARTDAKEVALMASWHRFRLADPSLDTKQVRQTYASLWPYRVYRLMTGSPKGKPAGPRDGDRTGNPLGEES